MENPEDLVAKIKHELRDFIDGEEPQSQASVKGIDLEAMQEAELAYAEAFVGDDEKSP